MFHRFKTSIQAVGWLDLRFREVDRWPREAQWVCYIVAAVCLWVAICVLYTRPARQALVKVTANIAVLNKNHASQYAKACTSQALEDEMNQLTIAWEQRRNLLPCETQSTDWVTQVSMMIAKQGLTLRSIRLKPAALPQHEIRTAPVELAVEGAYSALLSFMAGLYEMPGAFVVQDFSLMPLRGQGTVNPKLQLTLVGTVHYQEAAQLAGDKINGVNMQDYKPSSTLVITQAEPQRNPFEWSLPKPVMAQKTSIGDEIDETCELYDPLDAFSLETLQLLGMVSGDSNGEAVYVLVKAPDGQVYRLSKAPKGKCARRILSMQYMSEPKCTLKYVDIAEEQENNQNLRSIRLSLERV
ncbi:MAG: type 4a pilus biogenesis protein PilO [Pseudomonadota bacterium]